MWLVTTACAAAAATAAGYFLSYKYKLGFLSLMLWGATIMILVDHILGYEGGQFIETATDGLVRNGFLLGLVMLLPVFFVWGISFLTKKRR